MIENLLANIHYILLGVVIGIFLGSLIFRVRYSGQDKANRARRLRIEAAKSKIVQHLKENKTIVNDEVQEILGISDATATRYLQELLEEGKIKRIGEEGRGVHYELP